MLKIKEYSLFCIWHKLEIQIEIFTQSFDLPEWIWLFTDYGHNYVATELRVSVVLMTYQLLSSYPTKLAIILIIMQ
jgi:hypothetical protein